MRISIHEAAALEIPRHYEWYLGRNQNVATRLAKSFESTAVQIAQNPRQFPLMEISENPGTIRRARLKGFPLYVLYPVHLDQAEVIAVPHTSQETGYWRTRLE